MKRSAWLDLTQAWLESKHIPMPEKNRWRVETLLKRRAKLDKELAAINGLETDLFKQIHSACGPLNRKLVGYINMGYNPTWEWEEFAPVKTLNCPNHNVDSAKFNDLEAYSAGEIYVRGMHF